MDPGGLTLHANADDPGALDGKTVRGAPPAGQFAPHVLSFRTRHGQDTLLHVVISEKTTEIPVAQALVALQGRVCPADALPTHKECMRSADAWGGKTVLPVKNTHPPPSADLATSFASCEQFSTLDQHRGRLDKRLIRVRTDRNSSRADWPLIEHVAELTRPVTVRTAGKTHGMQRDGSHQDTGLGAPLIVLCFPEARGLSAFLLREREVLEHACGAIGETGPSRCVFRG
jgi:hypothetical protein